ncbi:S46 family peptidase [Anaeromyxobacter oryzae]|uniref:Dipeptidyl-peptidase n=1 Tax=Anaeromyxobacter oryzae TaxID=2918170 RepID=A0ABN6MWF6_9BACT|nr:S46 family peptidase [Anaeromyxobacter oryzae]BDG04906.1 dipeptidyl-peptidase [Anaeromyxobacter oryzae]
MKRLITLLLVAAPFLATADEGMWTYDNFPSSRVAKKYGFTPTPAWLEQARLASARLAGGCSASFVSEDGLVMTNHHCAHECIEQLSTAQKDFVKDGFYAKTGADEVKCPEIEVNQLLAITDVTARIQKATAGAEGARFTAAFQAEKAALERECQTDASLRCEVVTLYHGGEYGLYRYRRFQDVRLVFAPEFAIAFFGGDPDNFMFPRYDLDVSFLRVYDGGKPAKTPNHFRWSPAGAKAGELTFVSGHPGRTDRLLTIAQLKELRDFSMPDILQRLAEERGLISGFQLLGPEQKRVSTARLFYTENSVKARRGMFDALRDPAFFGQKVKEEEALRARISKDPAKARRYLPAFDAIAKAQARYEQIRRPYTWLEALGGRPRIGGDLFWIARHLVRGGEERAKPDGERLSDYHQSALPALEQELFSAAPVNLDFEKLRLAFWLTKVRELLGADHPAVKKLLGKESPDEIAQHVVDGTQLRDVAARRKLWDGGAAAIAASADPMVALARLSDADARAIRKVYEDEVEAVEKKNQGLIAEARFAAYGRSTYPDATFTLRLSYGQVKGWREGDREIAPFTTFAGGYERATGRDPFALPPSWITARDHVELATPFDFVTTNDIIGGNSGSPVFDKDLQIVGLVFDGNILSLGGDYGFDEAVNRTVAVDSRALIEALSKIYGATRIVDELRGAPSGAPGRAAAATGAQ